MNERKIVFISKATPEDDEFVLWLAPKLEAAGYNVFADILSLKAGDRWRKEVTAALRDSAIKMLLCCRDISLEKDGVQEEIGIGLDLSKELNDSRFIIPLRLEKYKKLFGIGEIQYIDFVGSWANGLHQLLDELNEENVPINTNRMSINPNWEIYKQRFSICIQKEDEYLTTNWVKMDKIPNEIAFYEPRGAIDLEILKKENIHSEFPINVFNNGLFTFMTLDEVNDQMSSIACFDKKHSFSTLNFINNGAKELKIKSQDASNIISSLYRQAWNLMCNNKGLTEYAFSNQLGFHINKDIIPLGKKIPWGDKKNRRNSMLRNKARGKVWQYGVTAMPSFWPFSHFKFKSRILFSEFVSNEAGDIIDDVKKQHKLRRTICSGWRNKAWHGRLMAYLKILSDDNGEILLPLALNSQIELSTIPIVVTSPITTKLPDVLDEDDEETDFSTLGTYELAEE